MPGINPRLIHWLTFIKDMTVSSVLPRREVSRGLNHNTESVTDDRRAFELLSQIVYITLQQHTQGSLRD